ncbi:MAG: hypothetical protein LBH87_02930 [Coriobacteriales bacterium]|nr:hypothetical protein [Coriobacteriales bacterium]
MEGGRDSRHRAWGPDAGSTNPEGKLPRWDETQDKGATTMNVEPTGADREWFPVCKATMDRGHFPVHQTGQGGNAR